MKYILILLVSFAFGQEKIQSVKGYDLAIYPPIIERCIGLEIGLIGSIKEFKKIHDAYECEFRADVSITIDGITQYYTFEDFAERLGF